MTKLKMQLICFEITSPQLIRYSRNNIIDFGVAGSKQYAP